MYGLKKSSLLGVVLVLVCSCYLSSFVERYNQLKESKLSLEYYSLYTYLNNGFIPKQFQEEIGIPKLMYDIGERFPIIASLSGKFVASGEVRSHDDSDCQPTRRRRKSSLRFFSQEGQSFSSLENSTSELHIAPDPLSSRDTSFPTLMKNYHQSIQTTKERLVKVWLNINEKVSSKGRMMKEQSNVVIVWAFDK